MPPESLQERYAPRSRCFGCGPANARGLRIRSFPSSEEPGVLTASWRPGEHHEAFEGTLNGGVLGTLLDCHSNWTASWHLKERDGLDRPPASVTLEFHVKMVRPTPSDAPLSIVARAVDASERRVVVEAEITSGGEVTATCRGTFVAVKPDHPAYERW